METSNVLEKTSSILLKNPLQNAYPILRIAQNAIIEVQICGNSVRMLDGENGKYMFCVDSFESLKTLFAGIAGKKSLSLLTDNSHSSQINKLSQDIEFAEFRQFISPDKAEICEIAGIEICSLTNLDDQERIIDWMLRVYSHPELNREFILKRSESAPCLIALSNDQPIGFIMTHCDAELGPVYVSPDFRSRGIADSLFARAINEMRLPPAVFTQLTNKRSAAWLEKVGCVPCPKNVIWFWKD